jgi:hypothetical protein
MDDPTFFINPFSLVRMPTEEATYLILQDSRFSSLLGCISDAHSSKTEIVVRALAICVYSLFPAGAAQTATALKMSIKTARGGA